jgi:predicted secreted protein
MSSATPRVMLASVALSVGALAACGESPDTTAVAVESTTTLGTFEGTLPCADCAGIRTKLTLYAEQPSGKPVRYELIETYLQTRDGDRVFTKSGRWTLLRGSASDNDAIVYQLDYDRPKTTRSFLKVGNDELRLLDRMQNEIATPAPHSLQRIQAESSMSEITLAEGDAGRPVAVARGQRLSIRLNSNPTTGYRWQLATAPGGVLTKLGEPRYTADASAANAVGGGGVEVWSFEASGSGEEKLVFEYRRPWERDVAAARTVSYPVKVR